MNKEKMYEDAKKYCKFAQIFNRPGIDDVEKIYENEKYIVYECVKYDYNEILDKDIYGENFYE